MKLIVDLFVAFMKIGSFTFGGGYAMLPMIQKEVVDNHKWATENEVLDYFAISQVTPGVIAVNTATFVGYKIAGLIGAISGGNISVYRNYKYSSGFFVKFCKFTCSSPCL